MNSIFDNDFWCKRKCTICGNTWKTKKFDELCPECGSMFVVPYECD